MNICLGFDGSDSDDWTAIRAETIDGWQFTPTFFVGGEERPTIWDPAKSGGRVPRAEVHAALEQIFESHRVERFYYDPPDWSTEGQTWELLYGDTVVFEWFTQRPRQMFEALRRFEIDLTEGSITHDGCPLTAAHIANARKVPGTHQRYGIAKPHGAYHQKIDLAVTSVLAHEAAADARAAGWTGEEQDNQMYVFR